MITKSEYDDMLACETMTSHTARLMSFTYELLDKAMSDGKISKKKFDTLEEKYQKGHEIIDDLEMEGALEGIDLEAWESDRLSDDAYDSAKDDTEL